MLARDPEDLPRTATKDKRMALVGESSKSSPYPARGLNGA